MQLNKDAKFWVDRLKSANIAVKELVTRELYDLLGDRAILQFDPVILEFVYQVRVRIKAPVNINTWCFGGRFDGRGLRDNSETSGSSGSYHRKGMALDFTVRGWKAADVRAWIIENRDTLPNITRMEDGVSWVHVDTAPTANPSEIYLFNP